MPRINCLYAWVAQEKDGGEGVVGGVVPGFGGTPFIGADMERMESYRPIVAEMAAFMGLEIMLVRFAVRSDLEAVSPPSPKATNADD